MYRILTIVFLGLISCSSSSSNFTPLSNFELKNDTLDLAMDLSNAIREGIILPSTSGADGATYFKFDFFVKNTDKAPKKFFYKIFYQNESYKVSDNENGKYNPAAANNFYGSWENAEDGFHRTQEIPADGELHQVTDSFRIVGNPRNEQKYYGAEVINKQPDPAAIKLKMDYIRTNAEWYNSIKEKSVKNKLTTEEQLKEDAIWILNNDRKKGQINNRWKRNPRVGCYSFMLIVSEESSLKALPDYISNIGKTDSTGQFINPFYFFKTKSIDGVQVHQSNIVLKTHATLLPEKGIFVDGYDNPECAFDQSQMNQNNIGTDDNFFYQAHFQQFFHHINRNFPIKNIPVAEDIANSNYSVVDYKSNLSKYNSNRINLFPSVSAVPGKTVRYEADKKAIALINPGNTDPQKAVKENVGVKTRIGFTYGKFRGRIHFPALLNKQNMWNGITCAFWLLYQDDAPWNNRSSCENKGYIPKSVVGKPNQRDKVNSYSEIDIEIVKTSRYWPATSYQQGKGYKQEDAGKNHNIIAACTNWDLACNDPKFFNIGVNDITYAKDTFSLHRWDEYYKALTSKYSIEADSILGRDMYFEIDWQPEKIIWRMGKDKHAMTVFGYMDKDHTKIPDNQMISVVTQEYHDASWWPPAPWLQDNIPFPAKDVIGYVYDIEVE